MGRPSKDPIDCGQNIPRIDQPMSNHLLTLMIRGRPFKMQILGQSISRSYHNMMESMFLFRQLIQTLTIIKPFEDSNIGLIHIETISQDGGIQIPSQATPSKCPTNKGKSSDYIVYPGKFLQSSVKH